MAYPATFTLETPEKVANWRPLVQWIMAIPHIIIGYFLLYLSFVLSIIAWLAIVFTGKMPQGIADFLVMTIRHQARISAYMSFLHGEYPPFSFDTTAADPGGHPVRIDFEPNLEGRERLTVMLRLLWGIPASIFANLVSYVALIVTFFAAVAVLFTGKWPVGMLRFVSGALRVHVRFYAYLFLLTDEYPPFTTD